MKRNIVLIIVFGLLLIIVSIVLVIMNKKNDIQSSNSLNLPRVKLFNIENEEAANKFEINYSNITIALEKDDSGIWYITSHNNMRADQIEAFANVKNFNTLIFETSITNMNDREIFGVDNATEEYNIWENNKLHTIYVGNETLDNLGYYVKYNDEIFKLEQIYIMALRKSVRDFREKDFIKINSDSVVLIDIDGKVLLKSLLNEGNITMNGEEDVEKMKAHVGYTLFSTLKAIDFVDETSSPKDYGFDNDSIKITIQLDDNSDVSYYLSKVDMNIYAKMENNDVIYEVNPNTYNSDWYNPDFYKEKATEEENMNLSMVLNPLGFIPFENNNDME